MSNTDWLADRRRLAVRHPFVHEQSAWAIRVFRFGQDVDHRPAGMSKRLAEKFYWLAFRIVETVTGISLPKDVAVGPGLRIWHFGGIFINPGVRIGANCTLRQGVTIGNRVPDGPVPVIGDDVEIGAYAQILGGIRIGNGARIGAMAVVLIDVPDGCAAVGNPARIVPAKEA